MSASVVQVVDDLTTVHRQIDYIADQLARAEARMIDPIEFGGLREAVAGLRRDADAMAQRQAAMDAKLDLVLDKLSEAKGGWRALMLLGGAGATLGSAITWMMTHTVSIGPK